MDNLSEIHNKLLIMFNKFHKICEENDLKYFMIGGTQLGAIRHKGFIPWDDDIDIGMPREDYNKFINLSYEKTLQDITISTHKNNNRYPYGYCKIYDKKTTLVEDVYIKKGLIGGIYIDVFRLDGIGDTTQKSYKVFKKINFLKKILGYKNSNVKSKHLLKNIIHRLIRIIINRKFIISKIDKKLYNWNDSAFVVNAYGAWGSKEIMKKDIFGTPTLYAFEGHEFYGVEKYDEYLSNLYGNYMELPSEEKRKTHHDYLYLNLNLPYEQYEKEFKK